MKNQSIYNISLGKSLRALRKTALTAIVCMGSVTGFAHTWTGTDPATAAAATAEEEKTVFLYNVGKQQWLCRGGVWGTEAVLSDVGMSFKVACSEGAYTFQSSFTDQTSGGSKAYITFTGSSSKTWSNNDLLNFYVDQSYADYIKYALTAVETTDGSKQYQISTDITGETYYMVGAYNKNSTSIAENTDQINTFLASDIPSGDVDKWILVSLKERKAYFEASEEVYVDPAPGTFLMKDFNFARHDEDIKYWTYQKGTDTAKAMGYGKDGAGISAATPTGTVSYGYYVGNGLANGQNQQTHGGRWTANIHGANGKISQTIDDIFRAGWYNVKAHVFTNATQGTVKLFASVAGSTSSEGDLPQYGEADVLHIDAAAADTVTTYVNAWKLVNHTETVNGKTEHTYEVNTTVYVQGNGDGTFPKLTFGVNMADANDAAWTCIDEVQISFQGAVNTIILDEDKTSVDYMNTQNNYVKKNNKKSTLYLHRTFDLDKWNPIILPVDVSEETLHSVFGTGTKLVKFEGPKDEEHPNLINFTTASDIEAGKLYVIKPSSAPHVLSEDVVSSADSSITLAHGSSCYILPGVSYYSKEDFTAQVTGDDKGYTQYYCTYVAGTDNLPAKSYKVNAEDGKWYDSSKATTVKGFNGCLIPAGK